MQIAAEGRKFKQCGGLRWGCCALCPGAISQQISPPIRRTWNVLIAVMTGGGWLNTSGGLKFLEVSCLEGLKRMDPGWTKSEKGWKRQIRSHQSKADSDGDGAEGTKEDFSSMSNTLLMGWEWLGLILMLLYFQSHLPSMYMYIFVYTYIQIQYISRTLVLYISV